MHESKCRKGIYGIDHICWKAALAERGSGGEELPERKGASRNGSACFSGYLDFAERQAEREQVMSMKDWAEHLGRILTMSGEQLLQGNGSVSHKQAVDKAAAEYRKYKARTLSEAEKDKGAGS